MGTQANARAAIGAGEAHAKLSGTAFATPTSTITSAMVDLLRARTEGATRSLTAIGLAASTSPESSSRPQPTGANSARLLYAQKEPPASPDTDVSLVARVSHNCCCPVGLR